VNCMRWLQEIEQVFESSECDEVQKVRFASQMLRGEALSWWTVTRQALGPTTVSDMAWPTFKKKILERYCNERARDRIEKEFRNLKKDNLSLAEYTRRFMEKLGLLEQVAPDEKSKIKFYLAGLPSLMRSLIRPARLETLQEAMEEAQLIEDDMTEIKEDRPEKGEKRKWDGKTNKHGKFRHVTTPNGRKFNSRMEPKTCSSCYKKHVGRCSEYPVSCYKCGKPGHDSKDGDSNQVRCYGCGAEGHIRRDCPKIRDSGKGKSSNNQPKKDLRVPGKAFQMTAEEARDATDVVTGTFLINSIPARVLFDSGANRSFVSMTFCKQFDMLASTLLDALVVEIANGGSVNTGGL